MVVRCVTTILAACIVLAVLAVLGVSAFASTVRRTTTGSGRVARAVPQLLHAEIRRTGDRDRVEKIKGKR